MALTLVLAGSASAQESGFFGPNKGFELQPEVDAYYHVEEDLRLRMQVQSTIIPSEDNAAINVGGFVEWLLSPLARQLLHPDRSKTRALALSLGVRYYGTLDPGTVGPSQTLVLQGDFIPRYFLPWSILLINRNRVQARWELETSDPFSFRYLGRLLLERELEIDKVGLTPFADVEFQSGVSPGDVEGVLAEGGLQCSFGGQVLEAKYSAITYLQPSRSWRPMVSVIWRVFF